MTSPIAFENASPRFALPLLFAGQAQKEFYVNQAHLLTDALLHPVVEGTLGAPPATAESGQAWIVAAGASGLWSDQPGRLAIRQGGTWFYAAPVQGMRVFDRSAGCLAIFSDTWRHVTAVPLPSGGTVVDSEARAAIGILVAALRTAGYLPES